jgi:uncharacterized protein YcbX
MERRPIGMVKDLFRYPEKSMQGERLRVVDIGPQGVIGDRAYALREANGRVMTAKKWPTLLECAARYGVLPRPDALALLSITVPDGRNLQARDPHVSAVLSTVLGRPVVLERAQPDQHHRAAIDPATVFGDVPVETLKPGCTAPPCRIPSRCRRARFSTRPAFICWPVGHSPICTHSWAGMRK